MSKNIVHVIGTGVIGEPLIGLLARHKKKFNIDEVTFHKNTPLLNDITKVKQLISHGAILATDKEKFEGFKQLGVSPTLDREEAISRATVVIDCTPKGVGLSNKREYYDKYKNQVKGFIAQGSEFGFGTMYAKGITDIGSNDQFVQVVSCNTHSIAAIIKSLSSSISSATPGGIISGDFVCLRRANDISQDEDFIPSLEANRHNDDVFGTHHARDAFWLLQDQFPHIRLYSSAIKTNTQYMHAVRFSMVLDSVNSNTIECVADVVDRFKSNPMVALTNKKSANTIFSFGRDYGLYGRILSQTVVCVPTLSVAPKSDKSSQAIVRGICFTPQDGNSLLSSIAATLHFIDPDTVEDKLSCYNPYIFREI